MMSHVPDTIGGYSLDAEIGRGSTGVVYKARGAHGADPEVVALKVLDPELSADPSFRNRFDREVVMMTRLTDSHCVQVYAHGTDEDSAWIAMEYVDGATLRAVLRHEGSLTPDQACGVTLGALAGLGYAHALGLVHRDFKPDNVLVDRAGESKLVDFGLVAERTDTAHWRGIEGTPAYMSPEQVRGEPLDARSDLYSMGCVLYELMTGAPPFAAATPMATLHAHAADPLPEMDRIPAKVAGVLRRTLAKTRDDRPATAEELARLLRDAADHDLGPAWLAGAGTELVKGFETSVLI